MSRAHIVVVVPGAILRPDDRVTSPRPKRPAFASKLVVNSRYWSLKISDVDDSKMTALSDSRRTVNENGLVVYSRAKFDAVALLRAAEDSVGTIVDGICQREASEASVMSTRKESAPSKVMVKFSVTMSAPSDVVAGETAVSTPLMPPSLFSVTLESKYPEVEVAGWKHHGTLP